MADLGASGGSRNCRCERMTRICRGRGASQSVSRGKALPLRKLNTFNYPTVNFAWNFAHERSEYAEKSVGPVHLQTPVGDVSHLLILSTVSAPDTGGA